MKRLVCLAVGLSFPPVMPAAEPPRPAPPARYEVRLRYQIDAFRTERIRQYDEMLDRFKQLGFDKDPGPEDEPENPKLTHMTGRIAAANARRLLGERHVRSLILLPLGADLAKQAANPVRVQLDLIAGLDPEREHVLADQARTVLGSLGFSEAVGYDAHGNARLEGMMPANHVEVLLEDLRRQPEGQKLPLPFAARSPVLVTEVQLQLPPIPVRPPLPTVPKGQAKLGPELRGPSAGEAARATQLEVILAAAPPAGELSWVRALEDAVPGLAVEGRYGSIVTVQARANQAAALAALPEVVGVRLPRWGEPRVDGSVEQVQLPAAVLTALEQFGRAGSTVRLIVVDGDFRGWKGLVGSKLPASTRLLDLTAERNPDLLPDREPEGAASLGHGTGLALLASQAAPGAQLTLVRIDPASPYQLLAVARAVNGDPVQSDNLDRRATELAARREDLGVRRAELLKERQSLFGKFGDEDEDYQKRLTEYKQKQVRLAQDEKAHQQTEQRYLDLVSDLPRLRGVQVVVDGLSWPEGYLVVSRGPLAAYLEDRPSRPVWLRAARELGDQSWTGLFRDVDGNGVMEFAIPGATLPAGRWTPELNFMSWKPDKGAPTVDLPAGAQIRLSIQWQEPHDPEFFERGEDLYRDPLANLRLVLLRQVDPAGAKQPADDMEVVAQSSGLPQRLVNRPSAAVYEQAVLFTVQKPGHYALRVEGRTPTDIRPASVPSLPANRKGWELRPRLFVETLKGAGRVQFQNFANGSK